MNADGGKGRDNNGGQKSSLGQVIKAVAWSFLGVRKRRDLEADAAQLNPLHLIIAGVIGAAIFIGVLILVVHLVVS